MSHPVHLTPVGIDELPDEGHPLTTRQWAIIKRLNGWVAHPFTLSSTGRYLLVLEKRILFLRIGYVPYADLEEVSEELLLQITREVMELSGLSFLFIRYEFSYTLKPTGSLVHRRLRRCPHPVQPASSVLIHLEGEYERVRECYTKRARRALHRCLQAEADTMLSDGEPSHIERFLELYQMTAARDGFHPRSSEYIRGVLKTPGVNLFLTFYREEIVGGVITLESRTHILYLFGATARGLPFPPGYQLQDTVIRYACDTGLSEYDLHGIGTDGDHLSSLTLFKTSFGGQIVTRAPGVDVIAHHPVLYTLYRVTENFRMHRARRRH